jgi:hypothetical protein
VGVGVGAMISCTGVGCDGCVVSLGVDFFAPSVTLRDRASGERSRVRRVETSLSACTWVGSNGGSELSGSGVVSALTMSWMPARMRSLLVTVGSLTFVGNHVNVSHIRSIRVSHIQTR